MKSGDRPLRGSSFQLFAAWLTHTDHAGLPVSMSLNSARSSSQLLFLSPRLSVTRVGVIYRTLKSQSRPVELTRGRPQAIYVTKRPRFDRACPIPPKVPPAER